MPGRTGVQSSPYPFGLLASLAAHPNGICRNVAEKPLQIGWRIPVLHAAVYATYANQLTGIMSLESVHALGRCFPLCSGTGTK